MAFEAVRTLVYQEAPDASPVGIVLTAVSIVVMLPDEADATRAAYEESNADDLLVLCVAGGARVLVGLEPRSGDAPA